MSETFAPRSRAAQLVWPAIATFVGCACLIALGVWQLHRLAWKEGLIAEIAARAKAPPSALPSPDEWGALRPDAYDYRHVAFDGVFDNRKEALVFRPSGGAGEGPGYLVLTPLRLASEAFVIVNRGFVPLDRRDPASRPGGQIEGPVHVAGLMRPPEPRNLFTPADHPEKGVYFTRDPALIAAHFGLAPAAPFSVDADPTPTPGGRPRDGQDGPHGGATELSFPNNHLSYALTWFGLALALLSVFAAFAWRSR